MGLDRVERRLQQLVEGAFAKASRRGLQPVELARRMLREMDLQRSVGVRSLVAPNFFTVVLSPVDAERFLPLADALAKELAEAAREHAQEEGYGLLGPVEVELVQDTSLGEGVFLVEAQVRPAEDGGPPASLILPDGTKIPVSATPMVIGRLPGCEVVLDDPNVSRRHAELRREDGQVLISDLGSTNGTLVNGQPVTAARLADGDRITLGRTTLVFSVG